MADLAYATNADILDLGYMPETDFNKINAARPTRIPKLILSVSSLFDTYLRQRYKVPLVAPFPSCVTDHVVSIVVYRLYITRGFRPSDDKVVKAIEEAYTLAMQWLRDLADRKAALDDAADQSPNVDEIEPSYGSGFDPQNPNADLYGDGACGCG